MLSKIWTWILEKLFHVSTETKRKDVEDNTKYAFEYERIDDINFNAIFSNKLANYVVNDSSMAIEGNNPRTELLNKTTQSLWKKAKKIISMGFGYGGLFLVPYVKGNKEYYTIVPQSRVTIDSTDGDLITGVTILAERKEITKGMGNTKTYIRWTNYRLENGNCVIEQKFSDETGQEIPAPSFWQNILLKQTISNVDRVLLGYIKSPINNRKANDKYGVPICYGCDATIKEIKDTMKQLAREYHLKEPFVGVDITMFKADKNGKLNNLPENGLYRMFNFDDKDNKFNVYDPQFRDYTNRLQELYARLEHEVGTSRGILTDPLSSYQNTDETRRAMQDTSSIIDAMRENFEKGLEDFIYALNVLANAYNLSPQGDYNITYDFVESTTDTWNQLMAGYSKGVVSKEELRAFIYPSEDDETRKKILKQIGEENPSVDDLLGTRNENKE